jgi:hypothetical protein
MVVAAMATKNREEKMELKLKEGVDLSLLTTQHEIIVMAIELLDITNIHTKSEVKIELMLAITNYLTDGMVFDLIEDKKGQELLDTIVNIIEPFYNKEIVPKYTLYINDMLEIIWEYLGINIKYNNSLAGVLDTLMAMVENMTPEAMQDVKAIADHYIGAKQENKATEQKTEIQEKLNTKMQDLIQQYTAQNNQ